MNLRLRDLASRLGALPTLESGHTDDLKFDDGKHRVWVSRMGPEDYGDDYQSQKRYESDLVTVEHNRGGTWQAELKGVPAAEKAMALITPKAREAPRAERPGEHSQLREILKSKATKVSYLSHASTGRGAFTEVTLPNGHHERFAGRLSKREAVSNALNEWNKGMLARSHVPPMPPGTRRG